MKKLYINCISGVSGDMMLGAFLDLCVPLTYLKERLSLLHLDEFTLKAERISVSGREAVNADVVLKNPGDLTKNPYGGRYRNYRDVKALIGGSGLNDREKNLSLKIFGIKAEAEARVHGVDIDEVQFHEAGAVDSVVDIVGAAVCFGYVNADKVISRHVPTGYGTVKCACGTLPVPAPAVRQILDDTGIPSYTSDVKKELLTPTGASIIAAVTDEFACRDIENGVIERGRGAGKRDTGLPPLELILYEEE